MSCGGLSGFIDRILPGRFPCRGVSLAGGEPASVTIVLPSDEGIDNRGIEEKVASIAAPLGFHTRIIWVDRGSFEAEWGETFCSLFHSPWMWMLLAAMISLGVFAGLKGLFWTLFWGTSAWFISRFFFSFSAKRRAYPFVSAVRR
jgi:hypothetical protein